MAGIPISPSSNERKLHHDHPTFRPQNRHDLGCHSGDMDRGHDDHRPCRSRAPLGTDRRTLRGTAGSAADSRHLRQRRRPAANFITKWLTPVGSGRGRTYPRERHLNLLTVQTLRVSRRLGERVGYWQSAGHISGAYWPRCENACAAAQSEHPRATGLIRCAWTRSETLRLSRRGSD
jgi:hypothetical protein